MSVLGIIPARFNSKRLPGKLLREICGKTLITRTYENAKKSNLIDRLVVATDDERILEEIKSIGGEAYLTPQNIISGTERVVYLVKKENFNQFDYIVNIQGDEPFISPTLIDECIDTLSKDEKAVVSTPARKGIKKSELINPNVVKVIIDHNGHAIYFSRQNIPYIRDNDIIFDEHPALVHIGLYVYKKDFILHYDSLKDSLLEQMEKLEQLKIIENGYKIRIIKTDKDSLGIDTIEDFLLAEKIVESYESR
ncbi:MAG: 3-deoxy-manno-octulosonate cytidylyltransferase [Candidatus Marinimicrobia bacterium]|nr:3-deoxy-manno-octulosonate cytidylyltransferase [Candidatus Neomarinimicrobiota bacterium]